MVFSEKAINWLNQCTSDAFGIFFQIDGDGLFDLLGCKTLPTHRAHIFSIGFFSGKIFDSIEGEKT